MDTLEVLVKARAEVEKGWCQDALEDGRGNCCVLGALSRAERAVGIDYDVSAYEALRAALPVGHDVPHRFNNDPETTKADVLALCDRAINLLVPVGDASHVHRQAA